MIDQDQLTLYASEADASADYESVPYVLNGIKYLSIQVEFSDASLEGTLALEGSNNPDVVTDPASTSWAPVVDSEQTVTGGNGHMWNIYAAMYKYIRFTWVNSAGTGTLSAWMDVKFTVG